MGGKDTIVVDETADPMRRLPASSSPHSATGQKCSACSRAVIVESVYDQLLTRIADRTRKIEVGPAREVRSFTGPVASRKAFESISRYVELGKEEGRLLTGGAPHPKA